MEFLFRLKTAVDGFNHFFTTAAGTCGRAVIGYGLVAKTSSRKLEAEKQGHPQTELHRVRRCFCFGITL